MGTVAYKYVIYLEWKIYTVQSKLINLDSGTVLLIVTKFVCLCNVKQSPYLLAYFLFFFFFKYWKAGLCNSGPQGSEWLANFWVHSCSNTPNESIKWMLYDQEFVKPANAKEVIQFDGHPPSKTVAADSTYPDKLVFVELKPFG